MQVGVVVDPAAERIGRIRASDVFRSRRARGAGHDIAGVADPVHAAQAHYGTRGPAFNQRLAAFVPIAFKAIDKLELRRNLRGEFAGVLKCQAMRRQVALDNLHFAVGVHTGGQGEMVGRDHDTAAGGGSSADVVLKCGMAVRKRGMSMAIDQRAGGHGDSFAFGESVPL